MYRNENFFQYEQNLVVQVKLKSISLQEEQIFLVKKFSQNNENESSANNFVMGNFLIAALVYWLSTVHKFVLLIKGNTRIIGRSKVESNKNNFLDLEMRWKRTVICFLWNKGFLGLEWGEEMYMIRVYKMFSSIKTVDVSSFH